MPSPLHTLKLLGSAITVKVIRSKEEWGSYVAGSNTISINRVAETSARVENLIHEALHVMFEKQDLYDHIKGKLQTKALENHEEAIVRGLTPGIISLMADNGVDLSPLEKLVK